jgi:CHASE3 domain sensor protein
MTRKALLIFSFLLVLAGLAGLAYYWISKMQSNKERTENARRARLMKLEPQPNGNAQQQETEQHENKI